MSFQNFVPQCPVHGQTHGLNPPSDRGSQARERSVEGNPHVAVPPGLTPLITHPAITRSAPPEGAPRPGRMLERRPVFEARAAKLRDLLDHAKP